MRQDGSGRRSPTRSPDSDLWRASRLAEAPEDDAARLLDLASFADGRLDPDDRERVTEWLAADPAAAGDVAAARALSALAEFPALPEPLVARASALVGAANALQATVIAFPARRRGPPLRRMASWSSLVAAMAVASWLGFTLGADASLSLTQVGQAGESGVLQELLDPSTGFMRDLPGDNQT